MILVVCLLLLVGLVVVALRPNAAGIRSRGERLYLWVSPLPPILTLIAPGLLAVFATSNPSLRQYSDWLTMAGIWFSLGLSAIGAALLWRRVRRQETLDRLLVTGFMVAALPALLVGLIAALYALAGSR